MIGLKITKKVLLTFYYELDHKSSSQNRILKYENRILKYENRILKYEIRILKYEILPRTMNESRKLLRMRCFFFRVDDLSIE